MQEMLEKYLQNIGLTDKESTVYLSLIQVDNASVLDLSKKTKLKRPTVYVILESLAKKGLVSETTVGKKTHYQAEPPERLETFVERQKLILDENSKRLKDIIPEIKSIQRESGEKPVVRYFEGTQGIINASKEMFETKSDKEQEICFIYPRDLLTNLFNEKELTEFRKLRLDKGIRSETLYTLENNELPSDNMANRIKIDEKKYPLTCDIAIYGDKVRISILGKKLSSIFIQSQDVATTLKSIFKLAFDKLKN
jgi:HTH-type transcriptional regulator, sugar sensing transcriptional regulator